LESILSHAIFLVTEPCIIFAPRPRHRRLAPYSPQSRSNRSKGYYFLENHIVFQKVVGVAAVAAVAAAGGRGAPLVGGLLGHGFLTV
jgi:hypothetical protein